MTRNKKIRERKRKISDLNYQISYKNNTNTSFTSALIFLNIIICCSLDESAFPQIYSLTSHIYSVKKKNWTQHMCTEKSIYITDVSDLIYQMFYTLSSDVGRTNLHHHFALVLSSVHIIYCSVD